MKFNINQCVKVRLTDAGRIHLQKEHEELYPNLKYRPEYEPPVEVDGWSEWQLHVLMDVFSGFFRFPMFGLPFETEIEIIEGQE